MDDGWRIFLSHMILMVIVCSFQPIKGMSDSFVFIILSLFFYIICMYITYKIIYYIETIFTNDAVNNDDKDTMPKQYSSLHEHNTSQINYYTADEKRIPPSLEEHYLSVRAQQVREQIYQEEISKKQKNDNDKENEKVKKQQDADYYYKRKMASKGYWKVTPKQIREMDWREFESFVANLLTAHGYKTLLTPAQKDEGKDIVAEKDGEKYFIECKHWKEGSSVGREYLQKLVGAAAGSGVTNVIFIATCSFHDNAKAYAKEINTSKMFHLELWNINKLLSIANAIPSNNYQEQNLFN